MFRDKQPLGSKAIVDEKLTNIKKYYSSHEINDEDGVKVMITESSRVHVRPSNTEPIVRIFAEAESYNDAQQLVESVKRL